jgi:hypothetical protein
MEFTGDQEQMKVTMGVVDGQYCGNLYVQFQHIQDMPAAAGNVLYRSDFGPLAFPYTAIRPV